MQRLGLVLVCGLLSCFAARPCAAAKFNRTLDIGDAAPAWTDLPGTDGRTHSLSDHKDSAVVVVVFIRNHCPIAQKYVPRIQAFADASAALKVRVVAINVSRRTGEDLQAMRAQAAAWKLTMPYLRDESQAIGRAFGATATPQAFVLDADRRVAYMGAWDDHATLAKVEHAFVSEAVAAVLAGKPVEEPETRAAGCDLDLEPGVDVRVVDRAGYDAHLKKQRGRVVLVDFWLTTCALCRRQMPHTVELGKKHADDGLSVVTVCLDDARYDDAAEDYESDAKFAARIQAVLKERNATTPNLAHRFQEDVNSCELYDIDGETFPHYKLYDRRGKLIRKFNLDPDTGAGFTLEELDAAVRAALAQE